ncbi:porin [Solitalea sp. MAHUQ-68]|uniref:Porin n=1 Tax=Solitalea agri TaxID=2953739 RepID=A0A9X2EZT8_9SPHI|nr:porin [Solitalea agri]MCO4292082.1 porin [Solitalea agri]
MKLLKATTTAFILLLLSTIALKAQVVVYKDSVRNVFLTGYIQAQYEKADSAGIPSFDGGDFAPNVDSRFMLRRTRFAVGYSEKFVTANVEVDYVQNNVRIANAYVQFNENRYNAFSLGIGLATVPFGLETPYSSFALESAERSRLIQTLFPDEKDCGAQLVFSPRSSTKWNFFTVSLAIINGAGRNFVDYDSKKNFSGTVQLNLASKLKKTQLPLLSLGGSYYNGRSRSNTNTMLFNGYNNGVKGFELNTKESNVGAYAKRIYTGFNAQLGILTKLGVSKFNFEYIWGQQPGTASSPTINGPQASRSFGVQPTTNIYNREFNGYYVLFNQSIAKSPLNLMIKYDWYDPNTFISGKEIGAGSSNSTSGDIAYSTWSFGAYLNLLKGNARLAAYYDILRNEKTNVPEYSNDIKDDVLTLRMQFRF